ncbi:MAG: PRC-barrel domain-containing protein [Pseudooceanicola nanhaiensis]|uniref:PRC-barrel domain-containing protein n=1 Tax=Pseudooceanicola nanhaiensis TaxID=375761 RepID=UPI004059606D
MTPVKKTLISSAAALALLSGPVLAQDTATDTGTQVESTLGDGEINATATTTDEGATAQAEAEAEADVDPLRQNVEDGVAAIGDAVETVGEATIAAGEQVGDSAEAAGDAAVDTADAADEHLEDGAEATEEALSPDATATADAEAAAAAGSAPSTAGALIGAEVASSAGEDIGEIDNVVRINGEVMAVVGVGGFLGLGEHSVALPLTELDWQGETVTAFGYTEEQLKSMDEYDSELATQLEADEQISLGKS